jgi:hypothetical protein
MQLATVEKVIQNTPKGANIILEWQRPVKTFKGSTDVVEKHVRMVGRIGLNYDNIGDVQDKRESGELPAENAGLKGMEWVTYPYLLRSVKTGELQVRLYNGTSEKVPVKSEWKLNGNPVSYEVVEPIILASEKPKERTGDCFQCKLSAMLRIANEADWLAEEQEIQADEIQATSTPIEAVGEPVA